jgi:phosphoenolpyruvate carboxykinase (ATP)
MNTQKVIAHLQSLGITDVSELVYNPSFDRLYEDELDPSLEGFEKGYLSDLGAVNVFTGEYTGRSPKDKFIVMDDTSRDTVWWNGQRGAKNDNKPITPEVWADLKTRVADQMSGKKLYVVDGYCGANMDTCLQVRFIMEVAWQAHFVKNMFIRPTDEQLETFEPDFVVINASKTGNPDWQRHGMNSETFIAFNLTERMQLIGGTWYAARISSRVRCARSM